MRSLQTEISPRSFTTGRPNRCSLSIISSALARRTLFRPAISFTRCKILPPWHLGGAHNPASNTRRTVVCRRWRGCDDGYNFPIPRDIFSPNCAHWKDFSFLVCVCFFFLPMCVQRFSAMNSSTAMHWRHIGMEIGLHATIATHHTFASQSKRCSEVKPRCSVPKGFRAEYTHTNNYANMERILASPNKRQEK